MQREAEVGEGTPGTPPPGRTALPRPRKVCPRCLSPWLVASGRAGTGLEPQPLLALATHLHDRFLLFHLVGAGAWRLLRAQARGGRSGREQRGVFIRARVASSAGWAQVSSRPGSPAPSLWPQHRPVSLSPGEATGMGPLWGTAQGT